MDHGAGTAPRNRERMNAHREKHEPVHDCFVGGGKMGELMRSFDWSSTPLGRVETWPQSLKTVVASY